MCVCVNVVVLVYDTLSSCAFIVVVVLVTVIVIVVIIVALFVCVYMCVCMCLRCALFNVLVVVAVSDRHAPDF